MFSWVIEKKLARGARPRSGKKWARQVPQSAVDKWIRKAKKKRKIMVPGGGVEPPRY